MCIFFFFFLWWKPELWLCRGTQPRNSNKTQICTLNKSVDNSLSTPTVSSISELLSPGDKRGGQTNLMRNNARAISLFSDTLLPARRARTASPAPEAWVTRQPVGLHLMRGSWKVSPRWKIKPLQPWFSKNKNNEEHHLFIFSAILIYIPPQRLAGHICLPNAERWHCVILLLRRNGTRIPPTPPQSGPLQKLPAKLIYAVPPFRPPSVTECKKPGGVSATRSSKGGKSWRCCAPSAFIRPWAPPMNY